MDGAGHWLDGTFASIAALFVNQISRQRQFGSSPMPRAGDTAYEDLVEAIASRDKMLRWLSRKQRTGHSRIRTQPLVSPVACAPNKGKILLFFLLKRVDRNLESDSFLSAIKLTRSYYLVTVSGNKNAHGRIDAFSEECITDETHTSLEAWRRQCIVFLFGGLFQVYDAGVVPIYLGQFETFVLKHDVCPVDRIAQYLIGLHSANGRPDRAERVIWHIDPACLDIDQVVQLYQMHYLYDALIYLYTRAMRDYVVPLVEMIGLIRKVMQLRCSLMPPETAVAPLIVNAYKEVSGGTSRLFIVKILLERSPLLPYPPCPPNLFRRRQVLYNIPAGMNRSTREDCQLAAEYLLLRYSPHETKQQLRLFQGFHHILRTWHRHEGRWAPLLLAHIHGPNIHPTELFAHTNEVFTIAARLHSGAVPDVLQTTVAASLPGLLYVSVINTARFLDHHAPRLHERTNESMGSTADHGRLAYLCCLLGPPSADDEEESGSGPSAGVPPRLRQTTF
ncbi:Golgi CORVET complex core vacuolar protein 8-domain-containing protein [Russula vinacea]|nr:Golgi CORVET complex core vacuolar protein 8-domain-containing protein [Russula vinacea]